MLIYQTGNSWIVGSIHVLTEPLSTAIEPILARLIEMTDIVVLESAVSSSEPPGARLSDSSLLALAGQELYEQAIKTAVSVGLEPEDFGDCAPWWAALQLAMHRLVAAGFHPVLGIEAIMKRLLEAAGKRPLFLESSVHGLRCFNQAPLEEQLKYLRVVVEDEAEVPAEFALLLRGWIAGSTRILTELLESRLRDLPNMFGCLMTARNYEWAPQLDQLLRRSERSLVIVGALHLVGDSGVIALLEQGGHRFQCLDGAEGIGD